MYPLLDSSTMNRRALEARRATEAIRRTKATRPVDKEEASGHGVRYAIGARLVRAGVRLLEA